VTATKVENLYSLTVSNASEMAKFTESEQHLDEHQNGPVRTMDASGVSQYKGGTAPRVCSCSCKGGQLCCIRQAVGYCTQARQILSDCNARRGVNTSLSGEK